MVEFPPLYIGYAPIYRGFLMLSLAGAGGHMRGGAREAGFARSLRSLACSAQAPFRYPCAARGGARLRSRPFRGRHKGAPFRPRSAHNRLSPAFRPAPLVVAYGVRWRGRSSRALAPSLSLASLALLLSLLAPLPVGFCSRSSRLGGSTELACQVPRLVSAIPPRVSQSVADGCGGLGG